VTTIAGANAVLKAIEEASIGELNVKSLNEYAL
jgi:carbamoyl-phosphate synthase large subunit